MTFFSTWRAWVTSTSETLELKYHRKLGFEKLVFLYRRKKPCNCKKKSRRPSSELWNAFELLHYPSLGLNAPWSNELFTHHFNAKIVDQFLRFLLLQRILKYLTIFLCSSKYSSTLDQLIYGKNTNLVPWRKELRLVTSFWCKNC